MNSKIYPFLLAIVSFVLLNCSKNNARPQPQDSSLKVDKTTLNIIAAVSTDTVAITSTAPWNLLIPAEDSSWIHASIKAGTQGVNKVGFTFAANESTQSRSVVLTINSTDNAVNPVIINVVQEQPDVKINFFTNTAAGGASITINGTGFSTVLSENIVKINGVNAVVTEATATLLTVTVPMGVGSGALQVSVNAKSDTGTYEFAYYWVGTTTIIAGGLQGFADGTGESAKFTHPAGLDIDGSGNIYVADYANSKVRKITPGGLVSTLPGRFAAWDNPGGLKTDFGLPEDVCVDGEGNVYVAEVNSNSVSKISNAGVVSLLAGSTGSGYADATGVDALFYWPTSLAIDASNNLIVVDSRNHKIRKVTQGGVVTTIAGGLQSYADGTAAGAGFNTPFNIVIDKSGDYIVSDFYNNRIRKVTPAGVVTTLAGSGNFSPVDGLAADAGIYQPTDIAIDTAGNIFVCDNNALIRWINTSGRVQTIHADISFSNLQGITVDKNGFIYVSDYYNNRICKLSVR